MLILPVKFYENFIRKVEVCVINLDRLTDQKSESYITFLKHCLQGCKENHNHHIIIGFLINVQVQGQHPHQWAPFQIAGLLHAWQISHHSPGMSLMRVDGRELPLSAVPLCQLFPCHLAPPRPTLSINLYVKGCLDCTIRAFHMSIPSESSLLQNEVQILNAKPHK